MASTIDVNDWQADSEKGGFKKGQIEPLFMKVEKKYSDI